MFITYGAWMVKDTAVRQLSTHSLMGEMDDKPVRMQQNKCRWYSV